ncbi:MAG: AlwI family type II restriction endonuclease, partial [Crenarchaeota archaeon]|nr:AlwI family type II restriction endonuclease [Thermoproteota archaeon]
MQNFNQKIEQQLDLLNQFWQKSEYANEKWESNESVQKAYYNFIKESGFLKEGDAPRKAKDARQKTSGMRDIGLIDDNRRLTAVGKKLLEIAKSGDFTSDNFLQIPKDSFIYFQQLLKTYITIDKDSGVRPFVLLTRLLKKFNFLSKKEFIYLFPLCINKETTEFIEHKLSDFRGKDVNVGEIVTEIFMQQQNYKAALDYFIATKSVSEETFCKVGLNRKSKDYDRAYFPLYNAVKKVYFDDDKSPKAIIALYEASNIGNVKTHWRKFLFKTSSSSSIKKSPLKQL